MPQYAYLSLLSLDGKSLRLGLIVALRIWHNYREKKTDGLPGLMMFLWAMSGFLWLGLLVQRVGLANVMVPTTGGVPFGQSRCLYAYKLHLLLISALLSRCICGSSSPTTAAHVTSSLGG